MLKYGDAFEVATVRGDQYWMTTCRLRVARSWRRMKVLMGKPVTEADEAVLDATLEVLP